MTTKNGGRTKVTPGPKGALAKRLLTGAATPKERPAGKTKGQKRQAKLHPLLRGAQARGVRGRGRDIHTGSVPMFRLDGKLLDGEGATEIDFWTVVDFCEEQLVDADAQWHPITFELYGKTRVWTPDARLIRRDRNRPTLIEIKPLSTVNVDPEEDPLGAAVVEEWMAALTEAADREGAGFELITDADVRMEPRFWNAEMMHRALASRLDERLLFAIVDELPRLPFYASVQNLLELVPEIEDFALTAACCLDRQGHIRLDRSTPFRPRSPLTNFRTSFERPPVHGATA